MSVVKRFCTCHDCGFLPNIYTQDENKCKYKAANLGATMTSYRDIKKKSESDLQVAVGTVGPISVAIDASHTSFQVSIIYI